MAVQADQEAEDAIAEWSKDLEAVMYETEVEEAIREVTHPLMTHLHSLTPHRCALPLIHWTAKTLTQLTTSTNSFPLNKSAHLTHTHIRTRTE